MNDQMKLALTRFADAKSLLKQFSTKAEAVEYLVRETGIPEGECAKAYDVLIKLDPSKFTEEIC